MWMQKGCKGLFWQYWVFWGFFTSLYWKFLGSMLSFPVGKVVSTFSSFCRKSEFVFQFHWFLFRHFDDGSGILGGKVTIKPVYGDHFGRHLEFLRTHKRDFRGLLVSDSTHIPEPTLQKSAFYQRCCGFSLYNWANMIWW